MSDENPAGAIPHHLLEYFWEYSGQDLTWERSRTTIALRLLESGGMDAIAWLRSRMGEAEIRDFLERREGRGLSPRRLRFWGLLANIPRAQVDGWVASARSNLWHQRTHR